MTGTPLSTFTIDSLTAEIHPDKTTTSQAAAVFVADQIRAAMAARGSSRVIFATGASQYDFLDALCKTPAIDWSRVTAFHLDEYVGISADHPASFRRYLQERLFSRLPFAAVHLLAGDAPDPAAECRRYASLLAEAPVDIACVGIGENGHLAFNDPPADFHTTAAVHVVDLDEACRAQQVGEGHFPSLAAVPPQALSMTVPAILAARVISCVVPDARKAEAVRCTLQGPIDPACPASAMRTHAHCRLYLDSASASLLTDSAQ
ncbi:MAG: glucosamine-6-phosphate deaminase [Caldilineaceae bacterium]|nr:glucosamine-6-phosphate deaminase [Caldilineaceae bacterium]